MSSTPDLSKLSSTDLQKLIETAQQQIKSKRLSELTSFTDAYVHKVTSHGFTIKDALAELKKFDTARGKAPEPSTRSMKAKYQGPNGELWSGQGQLPKWMRELIDSGKAKSKEDFRIAA